MMLFGAIGATGWLSVGWATYLVLNWFGYDVSFLRAMCLTIWFGTSVLAFGFLATLAYHWSKELDLDGGKSTPREEPPPKVEGCGYRDS
jgi:hypothetical protein